MYLHSAIEQVTGYMDNFAKSNSDVIEYGVPSSMRACHEYINYVMPFMQMHNLQYI